MKKPDDAAKRRKRSEMSEADALQVMGEFCRRVVKMKKSTEPYDRFGAATLPLDQLTVTFLVNANFIDIPDIFEALRVAGGYVLPRKD